METQKDIENGGGINMYAIAISETKEDDKGNIEKIGAAALFFMPFCDNGCAKGNEARSHKRKQERKRRRYFSMRINMPSDAQNCAILND